MKLENTKPPLVMRKRSERKTAPTSDHVKATAESLYNRAIDKAYTAIHTTRSWFTPSSESFTQLESLSTVMFSPLAAHPVYRSETMVKAIKLMQQQQQRQTSSNNALISPSQDLVLQGKVYSWPSSTALLQAEIPEVGSPVSLFQGFASTYPSLSPKRSRRRKKQNSIEHSKGLSKSTANIVFEREKKIRSCDKISMQKSSIAYEIEQTNFQIDELLEKRKALEQKWQRLDEKDLQLQLQIDDMSEAILDTEEGVSSTTSGSSTKLIRDDDSYTDEDDYQTGIPFKTFEGHTGDITCLDFNQSKGILVSASLDGTVQAWDLYNNQHLGNIEGHKAPVHSLKLNEARLLTGSNDGTIKQWDISNELDNNANTFNETFTLEGHQSGITTFDANQQVLVSGSNDKTIKQWDLETQQCVLSLDVLWEFSLRNDVDLTYDFIGALQFWDSALATGTSDGKIRMWDLRTGQVHRKLPGHKGPISCLQFDEVHLVSGGLDSTIKIWDLRTGSVYDNLVFDAPVTSLQFDAHKIVSSNATNIIDVYNRTSFQHTHFYGHKGSVNSVKFHHGMLASGGLDCTVKLWSL